jgi:predicted metalloprotease
VQNLLGVSGRTESLQRSSQQTEANRLSVQLELQADCFAGVWARRTEVSQQGQSRSFLEVGDIEEALQAASMIGDDKLQMRSQGYVIPETFTHGSAEQRMSWFRQGLQAGDLSGCNTFR